VDLLPLPGVAVELLGDLAERVAGPHGVRLRPGGRRVRACVWKAGSTEMLRLSALSTPAIAPYAFERSSSLATVPLTALPLTWSPYTVTPACWSAEEMAA
jgi:hypothetical protein